LAEPFWPEPISGPGESSLRAGLSGQESDRLYEDLSSSAPAYPRPAEAFLRLAAEVGPVYGRAGTPKARERFIKAAAKRAEYLSLSPEEYLKAIRANPAELSQVWNILSLSAEDHFYLYPAQLAVCGELIREYSALAPERRLTAVSIGCAGGYEAYTLAMELAESGLVAKGWDVLIEAFDIAPEAIRRGMEASYSEEDMAWLSPAQTRKWFRQSGQSFRFKASLAPPVAFFQANVYEPEKDPLSLLLGAAQVVFCRGLSWEAPDREAVRLVHQVKKLLAPGAVLFTAPGELWPLVSGLSLEERSGVTYYRAGQSRLGRNQLHRTRKSLSGKGRASQKPPGQTSQLGARGRSLLTLALERLEDDPEYARLLVAELLSIEAESGFFNPGSLKLMISVEEALGRAESAKALSDNLKDIVLQSSLDYLGRTE
jgi:chemotaxis methyl-accepting protein methylase